MSAGGAGEVTAAELEDALGRMRARLAQRRETGQIPPGLEDQLDRHYQAMVAQMATEQRIVAGLHGAVESLDDAPGFSRGRISMASRSIVGRVFHRVWARLSARQTDGVLAQMTEYSTLVRSVVDRLSDVVESLAVHGHPDTERRLLAVADRLSLLEQRVADQQRAAERPDPGPGSGGEA